MNSYKFPHPRYGFDTSNAIESVNNVLSQIRCMPPLQLVDALYTLMMKCIYDRSNKQQQTATIADIPLSKFNN